MQDEYIKAIEKIQMNKDRKIGSPLKQHASAQAPR